MPRIDECLFVDGKVYIDDIITKDTAGNAVLKKEAEKKDYFISGIINKEIEIKKGDVPEVYVKVDFKTVDAEKTADGKEAYLKKKITELKASDEFIKEKSEKVFETPKEIESGEKEITKKS